VKYQAPQPHQERETASVWLRSGRLCAGVDGRVLGSASARGVVPPGCPMPNCRASPPALIRRGLPPLRAAPSAGLVPLAACWLGRLLINRPLGLSPSCSGRRAVGLPLSARVLVPLSLLAIVLVVEIIAPGSLLAVPIIQSLRAENIANGHRPGSRVWGCYLGLPFMAGQKNRLSSMGSAFRNSWQLFLHPRGDRPLFTHFLHNLFACQMLRQRTEETSPCA